MFDFICRNLFSVTRQDIKMPLCLFNKLCNDHGHTQKCDFSVLHLKDTLRANLIQNIKIVSLSCDFVPRLIRVCRIQRWCSLFLFSTQNTFLDKFGPKIQDCLFKVKFGTLTNTNMQKNWMVFLFLARNTLFEQIWGKNQKCQIKIKCGN